MEQKIDIIKVNRELQKLKSDFDKLKEELEFALSTEKAWKELEQGKFKKMSVQDFFNEIKDLK